jgi:hypothetical protein
MTRAIVVATATATKSAFVVTHIMARAIIRTATATSAIDRHSFFSRQIDEPLLICRFHDRSLQVSLNES